MERRLLSRKQQKDLADRLENGEDADDICQEWFGLESDYLFELIEYL